MRLLTIPSLIIALSCSLVACSQDSSNSATDNSPKTTQEIQASKADPTLPTYVALTDIPYPPFEMRGEDGTIAGMEIEIFDAIAKNQKFNIEYAPHVWEGIFAKMNEGDAHFIVSAVTMTDEAKEGALLSEPYYFSPYRAVALDKSKLDNWKNLKVGISAGEDADEDLPELGVKSTNLTTYNTVFTALSAMIRGEVDVVVADSAVLLYNMNSESAKEYHSQFVSKIIDEEDTDGSQLVFAVDKAHPELVEKINAGLKSIKESGELNKILAKYNQTDTYAEFIKNGK